MSWDYYDSTEECELSLNNHASSFVLCRVDLGTDEFDFGVI